MSPGRSSDGVVLSSTPAQGLRGRRKIRPVLFRLMTPLLPTMTTLLETQWIARTLRSTNITVRLSLPPRLASRPRTRVWIEMLRVEAGLLVTTVLGPSDRVWVTVMCRCRLFESRLGRILVVESGRLASLKSLPMCPLRLVLAFKPRMCTGLSSRL